VRKPILCMLLNIRELQLCGGAGQTVQIFIGRCSWQGHIRRKRNTYSRSV